jgi:hypothetical protein
MHSLQWPVSAPLPTASSPLFASIFDTQSRGSRLTTFPAHFSDSNGAPTSRSSSHTSFRSCLYVNILAAFLLGGIDESVDTVRNEHLVSAIVISVLGIVGYVKGLYESMGVRPTCLTTNRLAITTAAPPGAPSPPPRTSRLDPLMTDQGWRFSPRADGALLWTSLNGIPRSAANSRGIIKSRSLIRLRCISVVPPPISAAWRPT